MIRFPVDEIIAASLGEDEVDETAQHPRDDLEVEAGNRRDDARIKEISLMAAEDISEAAGPQRGQGEEETHLAATIVLADATEL